jgi:hypothetical protein
VNHWAELLGIFGVFAGALALFLILVCYALGWWE